MNRGEETDAVPLAGTEPRDSAPLEIAYAIRWLVPKGERFANFDILNDNDTQLGRCRHQGRIREAVRP